MYRIAIEKLYKWKNSKRRKPLIIEGARQVGKTSASTAVLRLAHRAHRKDEDHHFVRRFAALNQYELDKDFEMYDFCK